MKILSEHYPESVSLEQLSKAADIPKSTCVHILNTLIDETLAERIKYSRYILGVGCFYLTRSGKFDSKRIDICRPVLQWLRNKTGETALIAELHNSEKYTLDYAIGNYKLQNSGYDILLDDIYRTASGRLLTAHLSDDRLFDLISRHGLPKSPEWTDFPNISAFQKALKVLRDEPWISVENQYTIGYAAPLYDGKTVFAAIGLAVSKSSFSPDFSEIRLVQHLLHAAKEINRRLKF